MEKPRPMLQTLGALARPVLGSMALSVGGLVVVRGFANFKVLEASNDVVGNYLQTVGSIYAVLLAFVVFVVWTQFNDARGQVDRESNELLDLYRSARGLPEPTRGLVHAAARSYAETVISDEWEGMACGRIVGPGAGARILDQMWELVHASEIGPDPERSDYRAVLRALDDLSDARSNRLTSSRVRIPRTMRILLYTGAVTVVGSMYLFAVGSLFVHAAITAALAGAVSHVLFIVEDLDSCFAGHWQVSRAPFERVLQQMTPAAATAPPRSVSAA